MEPFTAKWSRDDVADRKTKEGDTWRVKMEVEEQPRCRTGGDQSPPFINLDLGIGGPGSWGSEHHHHRLKNNPCTPATAVKMEDGDCGDQDQDQDQDRTVQEEREEQRSRKCSVFCFTGEQMEELKTQMLIFKYMLSGLPVPLQLLPIWRCFSSSSSFPLYCDLRWRNPCLVGSYNWGFDNRYLMDPEPGRCRRTDGKKWRCHQGVIPNEKYCERHMHRGSKRSRKLLESSSQASLNPGTLNLMSTNSNNNSSSDLKIKFPANLNQKFQFPDQKSPMNSYSSVGNCIESNNGPTKVVIRVPCSTNKSNSNEHNKQNNVGKDNSIMKERMTAINLSSGLEFSPKSVLQDDKKCPQVENPKTNSNARDERCRRTDGKKWQCRKNVLPNQKYCAHHINRGAKRPVAFPTSPEAEPLFGSVHNAKFYGSKQAKASRHPNTDLNVTLTIGSGDPRCNTTDESMANNGDSGSTTETTITDDSVDISNMIVLSP